MWQCSVGPRKRLRNKGKTWREAERPNQREAGKQRALLRTPDLVKKPQRRPIACIDDVPPSYILNTAEIAKLFDLSQGKAGEMLATGEVVGGFPVGRLLRIYARDLAAWIDSQKLPKSPEIAALRERLRARRATR